MALSCVGFLHISPGWFLQIIPGWFLHIISGWFLHISPGWFLHISPGNSNCDKTTSSPSQVRGTRPTAEWNVFMCFLIISFFNKFFMKIWLWYLGWCWADGRAEYTQWTEKCRSLSTLNRTIDLMYLFVGFYHRPNLFGFFSTVPSTPTPKVYLLLFFCCLLIRVNQGQVTTGCDSNHSYLSLVSPEPDTLFLFLLFPLPNWSFSPFSFLPSLLSSLLVLLSGLRWISWCFQSRNHTGIQPSQCCLCFLCFRACRNLNKCSFW